ncbi:helix-turn-helix domain-containing protein [Catenovulum sp. SX2]|uniref:helix-turn-helix domain-containing protein n=1 Tax=Catenovulum sp. SX2 TaxID=3398614 RepID=UPI003F850572
MQINQTIKHLRQQKGWTQAQLAEISGLSERTIQRLENGGEPSTESLTALAAVFETSLQDLKPQPLRTQFSAPMSKNLLISSCVVCLFLVGSELLFTHKLVYSLPLLIGLYLLFSVKGYSIKDGCLLIHHLGWSSKYALSDISQVEVNPQAMMGSIRLFGIDQLYAAVGHFKNDVLGKYQAYATNAQNSVVLTISGKTFVITPDDPQAFKQSLDANTKHT